MRAAAILPLLCVAAVCGCGPRFDASGVRNVLLISIDTLRADRLGSYGFARDTTPNLDALARDGVRFERAISSNPITLPSHATLLTGRTPLQHGVHDNEGYQLPEAETSLAEILRDEGFATAAVVGAIVLNERVGIAQGFEQFDGAASGVRESAYRSRTAGEVTNSALRSLSERDPQRPFFLFVHYYDPHNEYRPPEPYASRFRDDPYAGEVAYVDAQIGRLLATLREQGLDRSTLVVVTSDHGESFGEHGETGHSWFVYDETQRIPLILTAPGARGERVVTETVGLVDVAPTVLGVLGLTPPPRMSGRDLGPLLRGERGDEARAIYSESLSPTKLGANPLFALTAGRWKYILTSRPELYDLAADPRELHDLSSREPERAALLRKSLERRLEGAGESARLELDEEGILALRALGYLGETVREEPVLRDGLPDPKDRIAEFTRTGEIVYLMGQARYDRAREAAQALRRDRPDLADVHRLLGMIERYAGSDRAAIASFQVYLRMRESQGHAEPVSATDRLRLAEVHANVGGAHFNLGDLEEALHWFDRAIEIEPEFAHPHFQRGATLQRLGRLEEAVAPYRAALRIDPQHELSRAALAELEGPSSRGSAR